MSKENFNETVSSLFNGMEGFLTSKTVVGEPIYIKDTIILPLVDVSFGMGAGAFEADKKNKSGGGIGGKLTPSAVLVIRDGQTKLVNVKNQETIVKLLDMVPDVIDKFTKKEETLEDIVEDLEKEE
ncbi:MULTISPECIES: GerW family sporulation protein [Anaerostipes]|uniref:GerW family sporulation protein n=1 Tax=Anaerostipes TaxID=207244 RepID=UPI000950D269|nr:MULTISPECIES: GerW family sporulation protein [Anaerostipes]MCI5622680.1 GerW family sporulation protein [Anaerostipes sp.]MDY2725750.1 GerW family sporulation protein [Anaerostipes faecalis]OLR58847.1 sporulation protein [Anaerostipes sp. 494a]